MLYQTPRYFSTYSDFPVKNSFVLNKKRLGHRSLQFSVTENCFHYSIIQTIQIVLGNHFYSKIIPEGWLLYFFSPDKENEPMPIHNHKHLHARTVKQQNLLNIY